MTDIIAQDCRLEGFSSNRMSRIYRAMHLPTGLMIEFANGLSKREAMNRLQKALDERETRTAISSTRLGGARE